MSDRFVSQKVIPLTFSFLPLAFHSLASTRNRPASRRAIARGHAITQGQIVNAYGETAEQRQMRQLEQQRKKRVAANRARNDKINSNTLRPFELPKSPSLEPKKKSTLTHEEFARRLTDHASTIDLKSSLESDDEEEEVRFKSPALRKRTPFAGGHKQDSLQRGAGDDSIHIRFEQEGTIRNPHTFASAAISRRTSTPHPKKRRSIEQADPTGEDIYLDDSHTMAPLASSSDTKNKFDDSHTMAPLAPSSGINNKIKLVGFGASLFAGLLFCVGLYKVITDYPVVAFFSFVFTSALAIYGLSSGFIKLGN